MPRPRRWGPYKKHLLDPSTSIPRTTAWVRQQELMQICRSEVQMDEDRSFEEVSDISSTVSLQVEYGDECSSVCADLEAVYSTPDYPLTNDTKDSTIPLSHRVDVLEDKIKNLEEELAAYKRIAGLCEDFPNLLTRIQEILSLPSKHPVNPGSHSKEANEKYCTVLNNDSLFQQVFGSIKKKTNYTESSPFATMSDEEGSVQFGTKKLQRCQIRKLCHRKDTILAAELCAMLFSPEEMALCSMKGKVNNKCKESFRKLPIDESRVKGIIDYICHKKGVFGPEIEKRIKTAIANKLGNFSKTKEGKSIINRYKLSSRERSKGET